MCPPVLPPPPEIDMYWSDEQIVSLLADYTPGSHLPVNVLPDCSPYRYSPSNLPEGIWYLVDSNEKKESDCGFWKAKGEACKVYSNFMINGWRTTLVYFEGKAPHGQITDWLMQEYGIRPKELSDKDEPEDSRLLCRVFLCSETNPQNCKTTIESEDANAVVSIKPNTDVTSEQDSGSQSKAEKEGAFPDREANSPPQDLWEVGGDFLELNDLEDPISHSSSSQNSSCPSRSSDEYFDSSAFLRDIEDIQGQQSSSRYDFRTSPVPNGVVLHPAVSGSVMGGCITSKELQSRGDEEEQCTKSESSSSPNKGGPSRLKKLKTYFCFASL